MALTHTAESKQVGMVEERFIRLPEVSRRVGLGKTKIYDLITQKQFPQPVKMGRASLWRNGSISRWIEQQESLV